MQPQPPTTRQRALLLLVLGLAALYLLVRRGVIGGDGLVFLVVLFPSVILHEVSHGAAALAFGDDTAKRAGRLTLNPVRHVDPFGTVILPAVLVLAGAAPFGYARPVPVNPSRMRRPRDHGLATSLAGPGVNILLALVAALVFRVLDPGGEGMAASAGLGELPVIERVVFLFGVVNVVLAAFNLIPIPPLDGSAVIERLMPATWWPGYLRVRQYSMGILLVLVLLVPGALSRVFGPAIGLWTRLLA